MKVLIIESNPNKTAMVNRGIMSACPDAEVDRAKAMKPAKELIWNAMNGGVPYDLIINSMNFPEEEYGAEVQGLGEKLIEYIDDNGWMIDIIICSSTKYEILEGNVIGCVHFLLGTDLGTAFKKILRV